MKSRMATIWRVSQTHDPEGRPAPCRFEAFDTTCSKCAAAFNTGTPTSWVFRATPERVRIVGTRREVFCTH